MLKDITLGQYYPTESPIHKLDPRVKLFGTLVFIVSLFLAKNPAVYCIAATFLFTCIYISKVPVKYIMRGLKPVMVLMAFSLLFNIFGTDGRVLVKVWKLKITYEGLIQAAYIGINVFYRFKQLRNRIKISQQFVCLLRPAFKGNAQSDIIPVRLLILHLPSVRLPQCRLRHSLLQYLLSKERY